MAIKISLVATAMVASVAFFSAAHAASITNGSFEMNGPSAGSAYYPSIGSTAITGWTVINNDGSTTDNGHNIIWIGNGGYGLYTPFGTDFLDLTGTSDSAPFSGVSQTVATVAGQSYAVDFYLGAQGASGAFGGPISATASSGSTSQTFADTGAALTPGAISSNGSVWTPETFDFTATSASTKLSIVGTTGDEFVGLDNVSISSLTSAVPEPGIWSLMFCGIGGIGLMLRREKKSVGSRFGNAISA